MSDLLPKGLDDLEARLGSVSGSGGRFLLLIGDEGCIFGRLAGQELVESWFCPNEHIAEGQALFSRLLEARRRAPLLVLADVLEQMYREDHLPKVGPLDQAKLLRRRLGMAFPGDPLKGAFRLGGEPGGGMKVLMAVLAESKAISDWSAFLEGLDNPVTGYCLQPLEAVGLLDHLMPGHGKERHWRALIGLQATGGLRQIFTVDGRMVITRLTQAPSEAAGLALIIERELRSSISYLKRLGYNDAERLDLTVLGDADFCAEMKGRELSVSSLSALTPAEAAERLGLKGAARSKDGCTDLLLAEWAALRKAPALVLATEALAKRNKLRRMIRQGRVAALIASTAVAVVIGGMISTSLEMAVQEDQLSQELQALSQGKAVEGGDSLPLPVPEMRRAAALAETWGKDRVDLAGLLAALPVDAAQRKVTFSASPDQGKAEPEPGKLPPAKWELSVSYDLGAKAPLEEQVGRIRALKAELTAAFPDCRVVVARLPMGLQSSQVLEGSLGQSGPPPDRDALLTLLVRKENG